MMATPTAGQPGFVFLNRDNAWLDFERHDLEIVDGALKLASLPALTPPVHVTSPDLADPNAPAGVTVAPDGSIFTIDRHATRVLRIDGCDASLTAVPCLGGAGEEPTQFRDPAGLAVHPGRGALLVADAGNHRVQVFDLASFQLLDIWGDAGPLESPAPNSGSGRFDTPTDVAIDSAGLVYVVDRGNRRLQQFTAGGEVIPEFWTRLESEASAVGVVLNDPVNAAVLAGEQGERVFVMDRSAGSSSCKVLIAAPSGAYLGSWLFSQDGRPLGLAVTENAIYIGINGQRALVLRFRHDGSVVGVCPGYDGPVAGLAIDRQGSLLLHPGWADPPLTLTADAAFLRAGCAVGGPFGGFANWPKQWHSLTAAMSSLPKDAHVRFYVYTSNNPGAAPVVAVPPDPVVGPFPSGVWSAGPADLEAFLISRPHHQYAWVGVLCTGEGASTPTIEQIRLDFDRKGYLQHLPAIYHEDAAEDAFLRRYLALVEHLFLGVEAETDALLELLDPAGAPVPFHRELARWLALDIAPEWSDAALRDAISAAYAEHGTRGTARGLRTALHRYTGVDAVIEEPIVQGGWWALAEMTSPIAEQETSLLGISTRLVSAEPQGAVLGSTATVDRSHLIAGDEYGAPLFEGLAHRFMVRLHQGAGLSPDQVAAVEALIEREKPAHTDYRVCQIEPGFGTGESRMGIDSVIGDAHEPVRSSQKARLGVDTLLGGQLPGQIGDRSDIGVTTHLGPAAVGE